MDYIIETHNLSKNFGKTECVKSLNLRIPEQSIYGFLGPNGAGKSTSLKMILGLLKPTSGSINMFDKTVTSKNLLSILKNTGSLIESPSFYEHLTGYENLALAATLKGVPETELLNILSLVNLKEVKDRKAKNYSLGMKQRLGLAIALLGYPKLLILDEPTNGLDPAGIQEMRSLILSLPKRFGMSIVVSSHLLSEIDQIADCVGIINHGQLLFQDTLSNLHAKSNENLVLRTSDLNQTSQLASSFGFVNEISNSTILLPLLPDEQAAAFVKVCCEQNLSVYRMEQSGKSLEEIFLAITEGAQL